MFYIIPGSRAHYSRVFSPCICFSHRVKFKFVISTGNSKLKTLYHTLEILFHIFHISIKPK